MLLIPRPEEPWGGFGLLGNPAPQMGGLLGPDPVPVPPGFPARISVPGIPAPGASAVEMPTLPGGATPPASPEALLAGRPAPPEPQQPQSPLAALLQRLSGGVATVFAGPDNPALTAAQNAEARRAGLVRAGLSTILASAEGAPGIAPIAAGALAGQEAGGQARASLQRQTLEAEFARLAAGEIDLPTLRRMYALAVQLGDPARMTSTAEVIKAMEAAQRRGNVQLMTLGNRGLVIGPDGELVREFEGPQQLEPRDLGGTIGWFDPAGNLVRQTPKTAAPRTAVPSRPMAVVDPATGRERLGVWNPETRAYEWVDGALPPTRSSTEDARKAQGFLQFIPDHIAFIDGVERAPGRLEEAASARGLREFTDDEQQRLTLAGAAIAEAWLRMTTGAAYNEREFETAVNMFVPRPGDTQATLEAKRVNRQRLVGMLQARAGSAAPASSSQGATSQRGEQAPARTQQDRVGESRGFGASGGFPGVDGGVVTSVMGDPRDGGAREHAGIDVRAPRGTPIRAARAGVVEIARPNAERGGRTVTLRLEDGSRVYYAHLDSWGEGIRQGARVTAGQVLGTVGNSGNARDSASHVHVQAWDPGGQLVDPRTIFRPDPLEGSPLQRYAPGGGGGSGGAEAPARRPPTRRMMSDESRERLRGIFSGGGG